MPRMADRIRNLTLTVTNILMIVSVGIEFGCTTDTDKPTSPCPSTTRLPATTITRAKSTTNTPSTSKLSTRTILNTSTSISNTTTSKSPTSSTISITNTTTPRSASTSSAATILSVAYPSSSSTTAGSTTVTTTTNTASSTSRSTTQSESDIEGGLSDGGKIGIGVGIGVGGTLALVGILFIVLCRRYDWIKRTKTNDEITEGKTDDSDRNKGDISETSHYQQLQNFSMNPVPTYEQLTPPTDVDSTEQSLSDRPTYEHLGHKLKTNEPDSTEYEDIQQRELPVSDAYKSIKQMS